MIFFFFFSSRRRHTRYWRDWSSDVCSSDLRIHVFDIAQAIDAAFARRADGIFNLVDDEPASPSEQIAFAAQLLGIEPPPETPFEDAAKTLSPFALSFYEGCIRARNHKLKAVLGVRL